MIKKTHNNRKGKRKNSLVVEHAERTRGASVSMYAFVRTVKLVKKKVEITQTDRNNRNKNHTKEEKKSRAFLFTLSPLFVSLSHVPLRLARAKREREREREREISDCREKSSFDGR
jgi:hypothetical protein